MWRRHLLECSSHFQKEVICLEGEGIHLGLIILNKFSRSQKNTPCSASSAVVPFTQLYKVMRAHRT